MARRRGIFRRARGLDDEKEVAPAADAPAPPTPSRRGDTQERIRVAAADAADAAEQRAIQEILALEREREEKIRLIEGSDRRLAGIEEGAADAAQQMTAAEAELAQEAERLRSETERARE